MIGVRSLAVAILATATLALCVGAGLLRWGALGELSAVTCVLLGAVAAAAVGLVGHGSLSGASRVALDLRRLQLVFSVIDVRRGEVLPALELPGWALRGLLALTFVTIGISTVGNHGVERLRTLGAGSPPTGRCKDPAAPAATPEPDEAEAPAPPPVDQAGCALVRRAFALGYSKSLGTCAPRAAVAPKATAAAAAPEPPVPCERRHVDEPFLHFAWRRWAELADRIASVRPVADTSELAQEVGAKLAWVDALTATSAHALGATPHASHHLWISLPAPRDEGISWLQQPAHRRCEERYVHLPLWRRWQPGQESALVEHALGQLLFAARFGTTTACSNYRLHWGAPPDACDRLIREPESFLREQGAWREVAGVLDRRRRGLELRALAAELGRPLPPEPPPASAVVSLQCVVVEASRAPAVGGQAVMVAGQRVGVRHLVLPTIRLTQDGPIEVVARLAELLAGAQPQGASPERLATAGAAPGPAPSPSASPGATADEASPAAPAQDPALLDGAGFPLARLEVLESADPFSGARWPLLREDLAEIYPTQRVLLPFIEGFRRRYLAQRGRL